MGGSDQTLNIVIRAQDQASATLDKFKGKLEDLKPAFQKMAAIGTAAFVAIAAGSYKMVEAYSDAQAQTVQTNTSLANSFKQLAGTDLKNLEKAVDTTKGSLAGLQEAANKAGAAAVKLGFDDETAARSFAKLFNVTKDVTKANKELALAQDLARFKGISLEDATQKLIMVHAGSTKELKLLGIAVDDTATAEQNLEAIHKQTADAALQFSETTKGAMETLKVQTDNLKESIGGALEPVFLKLLETVKPLIEKFAAWAEKNPELLAKIILIAGAVAGLVAVVGTLGLVLPSIIAGFTLLAGPVGLIALAFAGIVYIIKTVIDIYTMLRDDGDLIWEGIKLSITEKINAIKDVITKVINGIQLVWTTVWTAISNFFKNIWSTMTSTAKNAIDSIKNFLQPIIDMVDRVISKLASIGKSVGSSISTAATKVGNALGFEHGGMVPGAIGQAVPIIAHGGETIIPASQSVNGSGGVNIVLNMNYPQFNSQNDAEIISAQIEKALRDVVRINKLQPA